MCPLSHTNDAARRLEVSKKKEVVFCSILNQGTGALRPIVYNKDMLIGSRDPTKLKVFLKGTAMSDSTKSKAEAISAIVFTEAYLETHQENGTIADLAEKLERSVEQVRAKRNSVAAQYKERGVELPSLKRMARSGFGGANYDEGADLVSAYLNGTNFDGTDEDVAEVEMKIATSQFEG